MQAFACISSRSSLLKDADKRPISVGIGPVILFVCRYLYNCGVCNTYLSGQASLRVA
jgi:hypothetical protein